MATFVHTADIHLDTPFSARFTAKQAKLRRKEVMQTFQRICEDAKDADFFLISGDLFDSRFVSPETVAFLKRCFADMPDTRVFISAGNHDPLRSDSVYLTESWGENVHIFGTEMEYVDFPELRTRVHGRSFSTQHCEESLLQSLDLAEKWCNLLVLHGDLVATGGASNYNPVQKQMLERSGVDYAALGHVHQYSGLQRLGTMYYAYPGIPEGRGFDEEGEKGYLTGTVEKGNVRAEWKRVCKREFVRRELDVSNCSDSLQILEKVESVIEEYGTENIYRILLTGSLEPSLVQTEVLCEQLKSKAFSLELRNEAGPVYQIEDLAKEPSLRGAFVTAMLEEITNLPEEEKEMGQLALELGLSAMERGMR
ncbi:MAG: DNA repair exonuclease [Clostridia bacterium]|nr:DNA repair exonuclease [Clostridia bacterium]